jgi:DNA polymerase I-like protein with 3'-5' exonuclease and polymerase domains
LTVRTVIAADFETKAIGDRPHAYPPEPVGLALWGGPWEKPVYLAWGHPSGNNATKAEAKGALRKLWREHRPVFHHSAFDCEVAHEWFGLPLKPEEHDDTLFEAFIYDPRADSLSLKDIADRWLSLPPAERDKLREWILKHCEGATEKTWGAYISQAPGTLAAPYAKGDVIRTLKLHRWLQRELDERDRRWPPGEGQQGWRDAYQRELSAMPVLVRMERRGVLLDVKRLTRDVPRWELRINELGEQIIKRLGGQRAVAKLAKKGEEFNLDSSLQLANALDQADKVSHWVKTAKGNRSVAKDALTQVISDTKLRDAIQERSVLTTYRDTYGQKWLNTSTAGRVYPRINQVRNREADVDKNTGTRTGRLSYSNSWQAIPAPDRRPFETLPNLRDYVVPSGPGRIFLRRDYTQQEYRILAHYEAGPLCARYQADPFIDMHTEATVMINTLTGGKFKRRPVKDIGFGLIYGMGIEATARKAKQDYDTTKQLRSAYFEAIPGLPQLIKDIKTVCKRGDPIRTWGGRLYWVEPPSFNKKFGKLMGYDYKMINVLIQGSAADNTKEAMVRADEPLAHEQAWLELQLHDELVVECATPSRDRVMTLLREAMEGVEFDVKMLSSGEWSARSWGVMKKYTDKR